MPEISLTIRMYYRDHSPPHFHAEYGQYEISVEIKTGVVTGRFSPHALRAVMEWRSTYHYELLEDWSLARQHLSLKPIPPLE